MREKYKENNSDKIYAKSYCELCGAYLLTKSMNKHKTTTICKKYSENVKKCEASGLWKLKDGKMVLIDCID